MTYLPKASQLFVCLFFLAVAIAGCDQLGSTATPKVGGAYDLAQVKDQEPPAIVIQQTRDTATVAARVDAGTLTLSDGEYTLEFAVTALEDDEVVEGKLRQFGTYAAAEGEIRFEPGETSIPSSGTAWGLQAMHWEIEDAPLRLSRAASVREARR